MIFLTLNLEANEISMKPEIKGVFLLAGLLAVKFKAYRLRYKIVELDSTRRCSFHSVE